MVIQSSSVALASFNTKTTTNYESVSYSGWGSSATTAGFLSAVPTATDGAQTDVISSYSQTDTNGLYEAMSGSSKLANLFETDSKSSTSDDFESYADSLSDSTHLELASLKNLLETMSDKVSVKKMTAREIFEQLFLKMKESAKQRLSLGGSYGSGYSAGYRNIEITEYKKTEETTSFSGSGTVKTADGKEIEFNLGFSSTSSFTSRTSVTYDFETVGMMDPLVVNFGGNEAEVSDQSFCFDLDCDGEEDNISLLGKTSGFLALDRNEDGIINDGSELFGATTGDGFEELAVFDLDGNGWIDENDEVFNHLKIWKKQDDGTDRLVGIGVAGIGAIYLGNTATGQTYRNSEGEVTGALRQTGIYLNEDGSAGTIQHVDLAETA